MSTKNIKLFVIDVDGTLTDGKIMMNEAGQIYKSFHVRDFHAIESLLKNEFEVAFVTEMSDRVIFAKLGRNYKIFANCKNKFEEISNYIAEKELAWDDVAYIGDSESDFECISEAGFAACPSDACTEIVDLVSYAAHSAGGDAALYEIVKYFYELNKIEY